MLLPSIIILDICEQLHFRNSLLIDMLHGFKLQVFFRDSLSQIVYLNIHTFLPISINFKSTPLLGSTPDYQRVSSNSMI